MSEAIKNGGPAFPLPKGCRTIEVQDAAGNYVTTIDVAAPGMSLRDYFAIHATTEDLKRFQERDTDWHGTSHPRHTTAVLRYKFADAMLKAREQ